MSLSVYVLPLLLFFSSSWDLFNSKLEETKSLITQSSSFKIDCSIVRVQNASDTSAYINYELLMQKNIYVTNLPSIVRIYDSENEALLTIDHEQERVVLKTIPFSEFKKSVVVSDSVQMADFYRDIQHDKRGKMDVFTLYPKKHGLLSHIKYSFYSDLLNSMEIYETTSEGPIMTKTSFDIKTKINVDVKKESKWLMRAIKKAQIPDEFSKYEFFNYHKK